MMKLMIECINVRFRFRQSLVGARRSLGCVCPAGADEGQWDRAHPLCILMNRNPTLSDQVYAT